MADTGQSGVMAPTRRSWRNWYDIEDALYISVQGLLFKLPRNMLMEMSEAFAGMLSLQERHSLSVEGCTEEEPLVLDWIRPMDWENLMSCMFASHNLFSCLSDSDLEGDEDKSEGEEEDDDEDDDIGGYGDGDDNEDEDEAEVEAYLTDVEGHATRVDPQFPFGITTLPRLRSLFSILQLADQFIIPSVRVRAVKAIERHRDFRTLDPREQLRVARQANVAEWVRMPFLTLVRARTGLSSQIEASDGELLGGELIAILWSTQYKARAALGNAAVSLSRGAKQKALQNCLHQRRQESSGPRNAWYLRGLAYLKGVPQQPWNNASDLSCSREWDAIVSRDVFMKILDPVAFWTPASLEYKMQFDAGTKLCRACYEGLVETVVHGKWLSRGQQEIEEEGLQEFQRAMVLE